MSEGTSLEALESGDISAAADEAKMAEIMREINAPDGGGMGGGGGGGMPLGGSMQPRMPMMMPPMQQMRAAPQNYVDMDDEEPPRRRNGSKKKNIWSSIVEKLRDPLLVTVLVFVVSLPVLHTMVAKYAGWAFAVGGQFSWLGLIALSIVSGALFGLLQGAANLLGL
jgi:hypothetical protein